MVAFGWTAAVLTAAVASVRAVTTVDPLIIKGSKFFYKTNGTQFFIRGIAYQQDVGANGASISNSQFVDPLADGSACQRDIPYLLKLRTNAIRVYAIDPTQNHDECMSAMAAAGIYVLCDMASPQESIVQTDPSWNAALYARYASVIDTMAVYTNTMGFFAGNEVISQVNNTDSGPFVKAAVRDMKAYIQQKNYRPLGVGYAADDSDGVRYPTEDFLNCGNTADGIDFFGYNIYSWCGDSNLQTSHYAQRTTDFKNYSVPVFFAEYGCIVPLPRLFTDTLALFSSAMNDVWSGGFVYEYFQAANNYGLVSIDGNSVSTLGAFSQLSSQIAKVSPTGVNAASYTPTNTALRPCPTIGALWDASTKLPPTPNEQLCSCMVSNLTCTAKSSIKTTMFASLFSYACPENGACDGIAANGTTGHYGAYSVCNPADQLAWAFNNYYFNHDGAPDACDFSGNATKQSPSVPNGCSGLLAEAGAAGTGTVTSVPTGTGAVPGGKSVGAASSSSSAAIATMVPSFDFRLLGMGLYVSVAAVVGAGMIML